MGVPKRTKADSRSATRKSRDKSGEGLQVCPSCSSILVQPVNWQEQPDGHWLVELRCPECEWWSCDLHTQREVDRFDEELDRGGKELIDDLRSLTRANMEDELDRFAGALANDCLLPEDF